MTPGEWIALGVAIFTVLVALIGVVVWLVRLEGKTNGQGALVALARQANADAQALTTAIAVLESTVTRLEREAANAAQIMERLAKLEAKIDALQRD